MIRVPVGIGFDDGVMNLLHELIDVVLYVAS